MRCEKKIKEVRDEKKNEEKKEWFQLAAYKRLAISEEPRAASR